MSNEVETYAILTANDVQNLANGVNQGIEDGWQPIGGMVYIYNPTAKEKKEKSQFAQAMVKHKSLIALVGKPN